VAKLAQAMGRPLMPWQRQVVDVALEVEDGRYVYPLVVVTVPRQSGKTVSMSVVGQHRALVVPRGRVWFCMQTGEDARDWFLNEHLPLLAPFDSQLQVRRSNGSEHTKWRYGGGTFRPFSPTSDALHGKTTDLVMVDEAWAFDHVRGRELDAAIVPTQATRPGAQVWKFSTAGVDASTWLLAAVEQGRAAVSAGKRSGICYLEWSCPDRLDPADPASWPQYHPAFGRTIQAPAMEAALQLLGVDEFSRAYGNKWLHTTARVIPTATWLEAAREKQELPAKGNLALGFDVALDRSDAAVVAAWRDDKGTARLEVAEVKDGAGWITARLGELAERWSPTRIAYDQAGPAIDVADQATRAGLELQGLNAAEYAAACAGLLQGLLDHHVTYRPHPALDTAAAAAGRRTLGDRWAWGRRQAGVSIATLTAATAALWAYDHATEPVGRFRVF
jgi:phage terminase large subunit-like protein